MFCYYGLNMVLGSLKRSCNESFIGCTFALQTGLPQGLNPACSLSCCSGHLKRFPKCTLYGGGFHIVKFLHAHVQKFSYYRTNYDRSSIIAIENILK